MFMLLSEQSCGRSTWSARATWCPRVPCWWPFPKYSTSPWTHVSDVLEMRSANISL